MLVLLGERLAAMATAAAAAAVGSSLGEYGGDDIDAMAERNGLPGLDVTEPGLDNGASGLFKLLLNASVLQLRGMFGSNCCCGDNNSIEWPGANSEWRGTNTGGSTGLSTRL